MSETITFKKLHAELERLLHKAGDTRALLALCDACYFRLVEIPRPNRHEDTMSAEIENALISSLALVHRMATELQEELDFCCMSLSEYGRQEGALKGLSDAEAQTLTKAVEILRFPDDSSKNLSAHIEKSWSRIDEFRNHVRTKVLAESGGEPGTGGEQ